MRKHETLFESLSTRIYWNIAISLFVHYSIVNSDYQHDSGVLYIFFPNKFFGQLLDISPIIL